MNAAGQLYIVAAPSGAGKTSLVKALLASLDGVEVSVSHTTRSPRPGETHGVHYHFVTLDVFRSLIGEGRFLEHAEVFGNCYGTSRDTVAARLAAGIDVILEIDWQGARQVRSIFADALGVFIVPPSLAELRRRLTGRGQDAAEVIERRMDEARAELSHWQEFDYVVVNDDFAQALDALRAVFVANRQRREVQARRHSELFTRLVS